MVDHRLEFVQTRGMTHTQRRLASTPAIRRAIAGLFALGAACSDRGDSKPAPDAGRSASAAAAGDALAAGQGATGAAGKLAGAMSGGAGAAGKAGSSGAHAQARAGGTADAGGTGASGAAAQLTCTKPVFMTADPNGGWSDGGYYVHNNMWNQSAGLGPETLSACSYHNWYVVSNQTNSQGAVKTYPNVHKDYSDVPISSLSKITSTFAASSPHSGIYDVAYDIWTNGIATSNSTEFMIWTENYKQVPSGSKAMTVVLSGRTYDVWKTSDNHYIAFVPTSVVVSGALDLLEIFQWTMAQGWLPHDATLGQICFGVEIVSTDGQDAMFQVTDFSITTQ